MPSPIPARRPGGGALHHMATTQTFSFGDHVVHAGKPEWGAGQVLSALAVTENGRSGQRLKIRFDRAGLKTISTIHADIRPADAPALSPEAEADAAAEEDELAAAALHRDPEKVFASLPEAVRDPFRSLEARIEATIALYRWLPEAALLRAGEADGHRVTVRALGWHMAGHEAHHMAIVRERYRSGVR